MTQELATLSDEEVLNQSLSTPDAFAILIDRYQEAFKRRAERVLVDQALAQDAVQDSFVKIYLGAKKFRRQPGASFKSWAYRILLNTCFSTYQREKRVPLNFSRLDPEFEELLGDERVVASTERRYDLEHLLLLISRLPKLLGRTAKRVWLDGETPTQAAVSESVSHGVIRTRLHRAKKELQSLGLNQI